MKECVFTISIHLRNDDIKNRYCVEAVCRLHKSSWMCVTPEFSTAGNIMHQFPLVYGGLIFGSEGFPPPNECLISKIPVKAIVKDDSNG